MSRHEYPFKEPPKEMGVQGFEAHIHRFQQDDRFVVKTLTRDKRITVNPEISALSLEEQAHERQRSYQLMKKYLGSFVPDSSFVIGRKDASSAPELFIVQERIQGEPVSAIFGERPSINASRIIKAVKWGFPFTGDPLEWLAFYFQKESDKGNFHDFHEKISVMRQLDTLLYLSLVMWQKTFAQQERNNHLPIALHYGRVLSRQAPGTGLLPEVTHSENVFYGRTSGSAVKRLFVVDNGLIAVEPAKLPWVIAQLDYLEGIERNVCNPEFVKKYNFSQEYSSMLQKNFHSRVQDKMVELRMRNKRMIS